MRPERVHDQEVGLGVVIDSQLRGLEMDEAKYLLEAEYCL